MRETNKMIRYTLFLGLIMASTAAALAHTQPEITTAYFDQVVYSSDDAKIALADSTQPLILQKCAVEDCSDTPQN